MNQLPPTYQGIKNLRKKLGQKRSRVKLRYKYYDMKKRARDFDISTPPEFQWLNESLGWCAKAVDELADRLSFRCFEDDAFKFNDIFSQNNPDIFFDNAITSALIASCCFVYIAPNEEGFPLLKVISAGDATGVLDGTTYLLKEGYAVLSRDTDDNPLLEAYFKPGETTFFPKGKEPFTQTNKAPYPLLVPVLYRPDAARPFGRSRISRACMDIQQAAMRTVKRSEISAEFYSTPQKYALGIADDAEFNGRMASISAFLALGADPETGIIPKVGQFTQQSMQPFNDQLKMLAALFAGETGLTLDDLGFLTDNPSSAEAIKSAHESLRLKARKAQKVFGSCFINVGYLAACVRDNMAYKRSEALIAKPAWDPVFEPDASALGLIGDGAYKINQVVPGYFGADNLHNLLGVAKAEEDAHG